MSELAGVQIQIGGDTKVIQTVGDLKKLLKEAQFEALKMTSQFGETSKEALAAAKNVAMLKDMIKDTSERVDLFDPGKKFQVFSNAVSAAAGGISALQGAMGLFGAESEDVQKTLLKVQSALALSQGLSVIADATKDFQRLGAFISQSTTYLKANELATKAAAATMRLFGVSVNATSTSFKVLKGAIAATGIGLLVVALGEAVSWMQSFTSSTEEAAKAQKELNEMLTKTATGALKAETSALERETKLLVARAKARGDSEKQILDLEQSGRRLRISALQRYYDEVKNTDNQAADDALNQIKEIQNDGLIAEANYQEQLRNKKEEAHKKDLEDAKRRNEEAKKAQEERNKREFDDLQIRLKGAEFITESAKQAEADRIKREQEQLEEIEKLTEREIELESLKSEAVIKADIEKRKSNQAYLDSKKVLLQSEIELAFALSDLIGRQTAVGKGIAIAAATINTYQAATEALKANYGIFGPAAQIARFVAVATTIATGLKQVREIARVQVPGGGGGGAAPSVSSAAPLSPQSTIAANQVTLDQRSINALGNQAIRAYVVENDITRSQNRIRRIERSTRFG